MIRYLAGCALLVVLTGQTASAQIFADCGRDGTIRRNPGAMVASGVCVTQTLANSGRENIPVTETDELTPEQVFFIDAIEIVFDQINDAIEAFHLLLLARSGETTTIPTISKRLSTPVEVPRARSSTRTKP